MFNKKGIALATALTMGIVSFGETGTAQAATDRELAYAGKALSWMQGQVAEVDNVRVAITKGAGYNYQGELNGSYSTAGLGTVAWTADPYLRLSKAYSAGYTGIVKGTWGGLSNPGAYKVAVYDKTDLEYRKATVPLQADGTWTTGSLTINGTLVAHVIDANGYIVAKNGEAITSSTRDAEAWIYSKTDEEYLQQVMPLKNNGTFRTRDIPNYDAAGNILSYAPSVRPGTKIVRIVRKSDGKVLSATDAAQPKYGLVRSYFIPQNDPRYSVSLANRSWIYDDALAALSFTKAGDKALAASILSALSALQNADGSLDFSYDVTTGSLGAVKRSGAIAWAGYAAVEYDKAFGDATYRALATKAADFLLTQQSLATGSVKGGPDVAWYSTEHNVDAYFFFRDLGRLTGVQKYLDAANAVKTALLGAHWNGAENRFNQGIDDPASALDTNSWGGIFLDAIGRGDLAAGAAEYTNRFLVTGETMPFSSAVNSYNMTYTTSVPLTGFKPYLVDASYPDAPTLVWTEGTWGVINFFERRGQNTDVYKSSMFAMQDADPRGGLVYSSRGYGDYDFNVWPSTASAGWEYLTLIGSQSIWARE